MCVSVKRIIENMSKYVISDEIGIAYAELLGGSLRSGGQLCVWLQPTDILQSLSPILVSRSLWSTVRTGAVHWGNGESCDNNVTLWISIGHDLMLRFECVGSVTFEARWWPAEILFLWSNQRQFETGKNVNYYFVRRNNLNCYDSDNVELHWCPSFKCQGVEMYKQT